MTNHALTPRPGTRSYLTSLPPIQRCLEAGGRCIYLLHSTYSFARTRSYALIWIKAGGGMLGPQKTSRRQLFAPKMKGLGGEV